MTYNQYAGPEAQPEHDKTILAVRMIWIEELNGIFIIEDRSSLLEGNAMLSLVGSCLDFMPDDLNIAHMYNVNIA